MKETFRRGASYDLLNLFAHTILKNGYLNIFSKKISTNTFLMLYIKVMSGFDAKSKFGVAANIPLIMADIILRI